MTENPLNDRSVLSPVEILQLFIITFVFVAVFGAIAVLLGGKTLGLFSESLIILPAILFVWREKRPFFSTFRLKRVDGAIMLHSFAIGILLFILSDELDRIVTSVFPMPEIWMAAMQNLLQIHSVTDAVVLIITAVILAGFAEEMLFRGLLLRTLEHYREPASAIVLSSVFFAIVHFNPWTAIQITLLGLALGYMAWKSHSILPAVILHACNNFFSITLMNLPEAFNTWYFTGAHVRWPWLIIAILAIGPVFLSFNRICNKNDRCPVE